MAFVFYDTETTGVETAFDQILQFAAIRTDADLNELDRLEIRCRLMPHVVPAPGAMRVTGVRVGQLLDASRCSHYEMVRKVRAKLLEWSPAVFIGYNSLDFDEHLLRQTFYKTLHSPYLTNSNGNCRADALRIVRAASMFAPEALTFPLDDAGKRVFKLEKLAPANGFGHDAAHDAMGDVQATIYLCRKIMERAPSVWSNAMRFSQKAAVIDYVNDEQMFCLTEFYGGLPYSWVVTPIGTSPDNKSEFIVFDLQFDPSELAALTGEDLIARLGHTPKPVRRLRSNSGPTLVPADEAPTIAVAAALPMEELERRADVLRADDALRGRLIACFQETRTVWEPSPHIEEQIYDGFWPKTDDFLIERFHAAPWEQRATLASDFEDRRLRIIARSLIYMERPDLVDAERSAQHDLARARRLLGSQGDVPWLTLPRAIEELDLLIADCEQHHIPLLQEHREHLVDWLLRMQAALHARTAEVLRTA